MGVQKNIDEKNINGKTQEGKKALKKILYYLKSFQLRKKTY